MDELILVDLMDRETGHMDKELTHQNGKLHRAFSVFLVHDGKMLIHKRNKAKYHSGGLWTNACCSHPRWGEILDEAVHRRLKEELGIDCQLKELFSFTYFSRYQENLAEYEYDHVFLGDYSGTVQFDPEEIEEVQWIELEELRARMEQTPDLFSTWFLIACPRVMQMYGSLHLPTQNRKKQIKQRQEEPVIFSVII